MKSKIVFLVALVALPTTLFAQKSIFGRDLYLGLSGEDVRSLQLVLNRDSATQIAKTGPGSPGYETTYFGPATKKALIKFQEKYRNDVLAPAGVTQASGYVGRYSKIKLATLYSLMNNVPNNAATMTPPIATQIDPNNPNYKNIDLYIAAIKERGVKKGMSSEVLAAIEKKIWSEAATTTDFRKLFYDRQKAIYEKKISAKIPGTLFSKMFVRLLEFADNHIFVKKALASIGIPFGGYITYSNPVICDCPPGITQLFVASGIPNPEFSNLLLNYVDGTEGFSNYNMPEPGIAVLGTYLSAIPSCWTYVGVSCALIPSEGQITPLVGSSAI